MDRFWSKVKKGEGCWEWTACKNRQGYGQFCFEGKAVKAHRMAYSLVKGPIPEGLFVMHSCDNPSCVNPDHLSLGTNADNMKDMTSKGRGKSHNAEKTHCPRGHEYTEENTDRYGTGRRCKTCQHAHNNSEYMREYREKNREAYREYKRAYRARKKAEKLAALTGVEPAS